LLAKNVNDNAESLTSRGVLESIASTLAPTGLCAVHEAIAASRKDSRPPIVADEVFAELNTLIEDIAASPIAHKKAPDPTA